MGALGVFGVHRLRSVAENGPDATPGSPTALSGSWRARCAAFQIPTFQTQRHLVRRYADARLNYQPWVSARSLLEKGFNVMSGGSILYSASCRERWVVIQS